MTMKADIELVCIGQNESFLAFAHGYPYHTVRWHYHPEYEIHLVTDTSGRYFVGDFIGDFVPGNLVMIGPNLPHNWVSHLAKGTSVPQRGIVVQFGAAHIKRLINVLPELRSLQPTLSDSELGVKFSDTTALAACPLMMQLCSAEGPLRARLFLQLLEQLAADTSAQTLSSANYEADPQNPAHAAINRLLLYLQNNYMLKIREADLAGLCNQSPSSFSRSFIRATGTSFGQYLNTLRVRAACELLVDTRSSVTDICFQVGYNSVSNFNRRFMAMKAMSPRTFRSRFAAGMALSTDDALRQRSAPGRQSPSVTHHGAPAPP